MDATNSPSPAGPAGAAAGALRQRRSRQRQPAPAALNPRTYDRTSGTASRQPSSSDSVDEAAAGEQHEWDRAVTPMERHAWRRAKARHWSEAFPLRMRRWIENCSRDVGTRIFCELVIRLPMRGAGKDEIIGLVESYGEVEYISKLDRAASVGPTAGAATAPSVAVDLGHSHIVRFREGVEAVRCFLELNGACIDPARYNDVVSQVGAMMRSGGSNAEGEEAVNDLAGEEATAEEKTDALLSGMHIANATRGGLRPHDLIFVTVDFFRLAFVDPAPCGGVPARSMLSVGRVGPQRPRFALKPSGETPVAWLARRLACQAEEAAYWFPLVSSRQPITWETFCTAANLAAFMLPTPTANAFYAATLPAHVEPHRKEEIQRRTWEPSHWSVTAEAMGRAGYDGESLLRLVDVSSTAEELMRGTRHKPSLRTRMMLSLHTQLADSPLVVGVVLLVLASFIAAATVFLFMQRGRSSAAIHLPA
jgi:hypothetical protein